MKLVFLLLFFVTACGTFEHSTQVDSHPTPAKPTATETVDPQSGATESIETKTAMASKTSTETGTDTEPTVEAPKPSGQIVDNAVASIQIGDTLAVMSADARNLLNSESAHCQSDGTFAWYTSAESTRPKQITTARYCIVPMPEHADHMYFIRFDPDGKVFQIRDDLLDVWRGYI